MSQANKIVINNLAITEEVFILSYLLDRGLKNLSRKGNKELDLTTNKPIEYFVIFLDLSQGLERLFKLTLYLAYIKDNPNPINPDFFKGLGHDIKIMFEDYYSLDLSLKSMSNSDFEVGMFREFIKVLNQFAGSKESSRYYNLNTISNNFDSHRPESLWQDLENNIPNIKYTVDIHQDVCDYIVRLFKQFIHMVSQNYKKGFFGENYKFIAEHLSSLAL